MRDYSDYRAVLDSAGIPYRTGESMEAHTTFRIGGPAALFVMPETQAQLKTAWNATVSLGVPRFMLGRGSNLLVADAGLDMAVICPQPAMDAPRLERGDIICGSGVPLSALCRFAAEQGLTGLEFAYGIPGAVGGAVAMNAGAYGGELKDVLLCVGYLDEQGRDVHADISELDMSYRHSIFSQRDCCIYDARFGLKKGDRAEIEKTMEEIYARRRAKQPLEYPSAGSTFKRPEGAYAAALIDQCGLKGASVGGAQVSSKHAGFVINTGDATAADVLGLIAHVGREVEEITGFRLEPEVRMIGF